MHNTNKEINNNNLILDLKKENFMKKCSKQTLVAVSSLSLFLLSACVSQTKYDDLNAQYQQLQAAFNDDQAEIVLLKGELKVTMLDGVLFSEGGYTLNKDSKDILNKLVPTLTGLQETKIIVDGCESQRRIKGESR